MGHPRKRHKQYSTPKHPWQAERLAKEVELVKTYGLRNKREVWTAESTLRKYRRAARRLLAESAAGNFTGHIKDEAEKIIARLQRFEIMPADTGLPDILTFEVKDILERRLQTQVYRQGLAHTMRQARQFITHGHIAIAGRRTTIPSYLVSKEEAMQIDYYRSSPLAHELHPEHPTQVATGESILDGVSEEA
ncbi:MAG TPA: 30S ribosomal protein S4 [Methanosarcinales archaeon]|nr:30S ribosomal protein S4 [Methanosarcinales archaeon]